jgi:hypothetical protein
MARTLKQLVVAMCSVMLGMEAQAAPPSEYEVKAAFIHNIAKFVEWPGVSPVSGRARLCLLGDDPSGGAFDTLQGMPIGGLNWEVVKVDAGSSLKVCRVLFIASSERTGLGSILSSIGNSPVLTVGDTDGYAEQGVMVNFYPEGGRVRFEINRAAAARAGLAISSQLLRLARLVDETGGGR